MKNYSFKIPVADILKESSTQDTIQFIKKFSTLIPHLTQSGISATIRLQGMDKKSLLLTIIKAEAFCSSCCDVCSKKISYTISVREQQVKCFFEKEDIHLINNDNTLYIPTGHTVIDIEKFLTQLFLLEDSISHLCTKCEEKRKKISEKEDEQKANILWK